MDDLDAKYEKLTRLLIRRNIEIATMESCTAGLVACMLTNTEGSSAIFKGSFITYSNEAKIYCGVLKTIIAKYGVYSQETADAMARAARVPYSCELGIGITGTFGNADPANADSIPGKVYYAISYGDNMYDYTLSLDPGFSRSACKKIVAGDVADKLLALLSDTPQP